jgi:hypothetical protein
MGLFIFDLFNKPKFNMIDYYIDSTSNGKFVFAFIESNETDFSKLKEWSQNYVNNNEICYIKDSNSVSALVAHFYNPKETKDVPEEFIGVLKSKYPKISDIDKKLMFIQDAIIFSGFQKNKFAVNSKLIDTVFNSPVFVPRKGFKAINILK